MFGRLNRWGQNVLLLFPLTEFSHKAAGMAVTIHIQLLKLGHFVFLILLAQVIVIFMLMVLSALLGVVSPYFGTAFLYDKVLDAAVYNAVSVYRVVKVRVHFAVGQVDSSPKPALSLDKEHLAEYYENGHS